MDNWNILLENTTDGFTKATVLEIPELQIEDQTKQGAVEKVQQLLQKRLAKAEVITSPTPIKQLASKNPLMKFAGILENDPDFREIMVEIKAEREDNSKI